MTDPRARFEILKRDGRCFVCLSLDHQSTSCEKNCHRCNGNHHQSICRRQTHRKSQHDLSANKNSQETQNSTLVTQSTEVSQLPQSTTTQVLVQRAQFYCKLLQRLQQMKIVQNQQELRSNLTMEVRDLM